MDEVKRIVGKDVRSNQRASLGHRYRSLDALATLTPHPPRDQGSWSAEVPDDMEWIYYRVSTMQTSQPQLVAPVHLFRYCPCRRFSYTVDASIDMPDYSTPPADNLPHPHAFPPSLLFRFVVNIPLDFTVSFICLLSPSYSSQLSRRKVVSPYRFTSLTHADKWPPIQIPLGPVYRIHTREYSH